MLVQTDAAGTPSGVTVDLARELAKRLGVALETVVIDGGGKSFEAVKAAACDVGFLAIEPARAAEIDFTAFVEEMKASGFVADALARAEREATVAPPAN